MFDIYSPGDYFDSRDVIERYDELAAKREEEGFNSLSEDEKDEYAQLGEFVSEAKDSAADWEYGATFIADYAFGDYAMELAEESGMIDSSSMISNYIDWKRWAADVKYDYFSVVINGETYWSRA